MGKFLLFHPFFLLDDRVERTTLFLFLKKKPIIEEEVPPLSIEDEGWNDELAEFALPTVLNPRRKILDAVRVPDVPYSY